jgi:hypothetical protein
MISLKREVLKRIKNINRLKTNNTNNFDINNK